ncbi:uncharacterized protein [Heptranchias perlo]|uniref:uncharacterized protein isoform X1 n=1 Tax=Heptranchias perlo TaxID=212740 RepID=UPI0035599722
MRILILLICSLPVSGALWAKKNVNGVVGRAITIDCHYDKHTYRSYVKYWCHGWTVDCSILVKTSEQDGQRGRMSITDNKREGIFVVTMTDLRLGDSGWYSCGIERSGIDPRFNLWLQISYESVSVPVLRFLSPANASCFGGSVSVSCESVQGSLPIRYTWYKKATSEDLTISESDKLDLQCSSFTQDHHQYYCRASNNNGGKSSEMVDVSVWNRSEKNCSYVAQISSIGPVYTCEVFSTVSPTTPCSTSKNINSTGNPTTSSESTSASKSLIYIVLGVLGGLIVLLAVCLLLYLKQKNKDTNNGGDNTLNDTQQLAATEESIVYANVQRIRRSSVEMLTKGTAQLKNDENEITYAEVQIQKKSPAQSVEVAKCSINNKDSVTYAAVQIQSQPPKKNREKPSFDNPQDSEQATYATITF